MTNRASTARSSVAWPGMICRRSTEMIRKGELRGTLEKCVTTVRLENRRSASLPRSEFVKLPDKSVEFHASSQKKHEETREHLPFSCSIFSAKQFLEYLAYRAELSAEEFDSLNGAFTRHIAPKIGPNDPATAVGWWARHALFFLQVEGRTIRAIVENFGSWRVCNEKIERFAAKQTRRSFPPPRPNRNERAGRFARGGMPLPSRTAQSFDGHILPSANGRNTPYDELSAAHASKINCHSFTTLRRHGDLRGLRRKAMSHRVFGDRAGD
jgi:hypothetical protein